MEKIWSEQPEYRHNLLDLSSKQNNFQMPEVLIKALHGYYNYTPPKTFSGQRKPHYTDTINPKKKGSYWNTEMWGKPSDKSKRFYTDSNYYDIPPHYGMPRNKKQQWANRLLRNENVPEDINQYYINKNLPVPRNIPEQWLDDDLSTRAYISALEAKRTESNPWTSINKTLLNFLK